MPAVASKLPVTNLSLCTFLPDEGCQATARTEREWPPVRALCLVNVAREKMVVDLAWAVASSGRDGCGTEDQARWYRSGWKGGRGVIAAVFFPEVAVATGDAMMAGGWAG
jgi:hypothetical protein